MRYGKALVGMVAALAVAACTSTKKVELEYEEPVTKTWTGSGAEPPAPPQAPAQQPPAQAAQGAPPQSVSPAQGLPPATPQAQQPQPAWRNSQPSSAPPLNFPDPSATTVVVPDQNPTTQTTLKKRTGWVRGGFD